MRTVSHQELWNICSKRVTNEILFFPAVQNMIIFFTDMKNMIWGEIVLQSFHCLTIELYEKHN